MNIEELKSILISANVPKRWYSVCDWDGLDLHVIQNISSNYQNFWETFYFDERGNINNYKSFVNEDIACRYFIFSFLNYKTNYMNLIEKYVIKYIYESKNKYKLVYNAIRDFYGVNDYSEIIEYDRFKRNVMYYMIQEINNDILLSLLFNKTKSQLIDDMHNIKNPNFCDSNGYTYLHLACLNYNLDAIKILLELGANPNIRNNDGDIPALLLYSPTESINVFILDLMLQHGLDLNIRFSRVYGNRTLKEVLDKRWKNLDEYDSIIQKYKT